MTITPRAGRRLLRAAVALAAAGAVMLGLAALLTWWTDLTAGGSARYSSVPQPDWSTVRLIAGNALTLARASSSRRPSSSASWDSSASCACGGCGGRATYAGCRPTRAPAA